MRVSQGTNKDRLSELELVYFGIGLELGRLLIDKQTYLFGGKSRMQQGRGDSRMNNAAWRDGPGQKTIVYCNNVKPKEN